MMGAGGEADPGELLAVCTLAAVAWLFFTLVGGVMGDRLGRVRTFQIGYVALALWAIPMWFLIDSRDIGLFFLAAFVLTIPLGITYGPQAALYAEMFPAKVRYSGVSVGYALGSILGGAFALLVVTPYAIAFLLSYARDTLQPMITLENNVGFILKFTLAFGLVFELPLILTVLSRMGVVTPTMLARNRKYAILGAFIAAAILTTTPDAFNQALMAGPLILLYEVKVLPPELSQTAKERGLILPERATMRRSI